MGERTPVGRRGCGVQGTRIQDGERIKLAWAQEDGGKRSACCKASCKSSRHREDTQGTRARAVVLELVVKSREQGSCGQSTARRERQVAAVMAAVGGPVGAQDTAGPWKKKLEKICYM